MAECPCRGRLRKGVTVYRQPWLRGIVPLEVVAVTHTPRGGMFPCQAHCVARSLPLHNGIASSRWLTANELVLAEDYEVAIRNLAVC